MTIIRRILIGVVVALVVLVVVAVVFLQAHQNTHTRRASSGPAIVRTI